MQRILAAAALLLGAALPTHAQAPLDPSTDSASIHALIQRTQAANNSGDVEAWVALFDDHAVYIPAGGPEVTTRGGLVEIARAGFRHDAAVAIHPIEIVVSGDWAFARTRVTGTVRLEGSGESIEVNSRQIVIYRRDAMGEWRIARFIMNSAG